MLGKYARKEKVITLADAVRKLSKLPAEKMHIELRGELKTGFYADIVIFDPAAIADHFTYGKPHQYATGVTDAFVNGIQVLQNSEHTGAMPGKFVKGPGWKNK